jgi:Na+/H+ antiporter NhaD/arsenite permease-like protein
MSLTAPVKSALLLSIAALAIGFSTVTSGTHHVLGVPVEFVLFACTLLGVATMHAHTLKIALTGLTVVTVFKVLVTGFKAGAGVAGLIGHLGHETTTILNLLGLLLGFALLADHFERSQIPQVLPRYLPDSWWGGFVMLVIVFVISAFLDNIAAALIGGTMAGVLFRKKLHIGYLAAIVAASNAGGAGSVVGDTTTTMMWIDGVSPFQVIEAFLGSAVALAFFGVIAARQQHAYSPITKDAAPNVRVDFTRLFIVAGILLTAVAANVICNLKFPALLDHWPVLGLAVWAVIVLTAPLRAPNWGLLPDAFKGAVFLLSLVLCASMMPVDHLPVASWGTTLGLGFVSAVFDNIPLTALALKQGGYDWGFLAYAVGFGGSMIWFGSSAGVALSNMYPEAKSVGAWIKGGWHIAVGYVLGFAVMLLVLGFHPQPKRIKTSSLGSERAQLFNQITRGGSHTSPPVASFGSLLNQHASTFGNSGNPG